MRTLHDPTVLCLEPDSHRMHELRQAFLADGFHVREAAGPAEALPLLAEHPDLLVVDVDAPTLRTAGARQSLQAHLALHHVPMLHLSRTAARGENGAGELFEEQDCFLGGPVSPRDVVRHARALLRIHRAESQAREAFRHWRATVDTLDTALCLLDTEDRVLRCNRAMAELLGLPFPAIIGQPFATLVRSVLSTAELALPRAEPSRRCMLEIDTGERRWRISLDPMRTDEGECLGHVLAMEEIAAPKLGEQVQQVRKLEALRLMVGGTAHDLNNLLTAITGNLGLILGDLPESSPLREILCRVHRAGWRAADLVGQISRGSPRTVLCLGPVNCNWLVEEISALLRPLLGGCVQLTMRCAPDLWTVQADSEQLHRVLLNLCKNAKDAMPGGGSLELETTNITLGDKDLSAHPNGHAGNFVRVRVADTGHGIPPEDLPRIFNPLFTTKSTASGVGLGLAIVVDIVRKHQGWIECASEVHRGTRFDIFLPSSNPPCHES